MIDQVDGGDKVLFGTFLAWIATLGITLALAARRAVGLERIRVIPLGLTLLIPVAAVLIRVVLVDGNPAGAFLLATALNIALIVGTAFDPLNAAVNWSESDEPNRESRPLSARRDQNDERSRYTQRRAWPTLTMFTALATLIYLWHPEWFGPT